MSTISRRLILRALVEYVEVEGFQGWKANRGLVPLSHWLHCVGYVQDELGCNCIEEFGLETTRQQLLDFFGKDTPGVTEALRTLEAGDLDEEAFEIAARRADELTLGERQDRDELEAQV